MADEEEKNARPIFVVDAFTDKPFGGNPAAVCLVGSKVRKSRLQMVEKIV